MMKKNILLAIALFSVSVNCHSAENDFDKVCDYFAKLQTSIKIQPLTSAERGKFISDLVVKNLQAQSAARQAWGVVIYAAPEVRYELYKTSAQEVLKREWSCGAMEALIASAGE